jgi:hypothetical protein
VPASKKAAINKKAAIKKQSTSIPPPESSASSEMKTLVATAEAVLRGVDEGVNADSSMDLSSSSRVSSFRVPDSSNDQGIVSLMEQAPWAKKTTLRQVKITSVVTSPTQPLPQSLLQSPPEAIWSQPVEHNELKENALEEVPIPQITDSQPPSWQELLAGQLLARQRRPAALSHIELNREPQTEAKTEVKLGGDMLSDKHITTPLQDLIAQKISPVVPEPAVEPKEEREQAAEEVAAPTVLADAIETAKEFQEEVAPPAPVMEEVSAELIDPPIVSKPTKTAPNLSPPPPPRTKPSPKPAPAVGREQAKTGIPVENLLGGVFNLIGSGVRGASSFFRSKNAPGK